MVAQPSGSLPVGIRPEPWGPALFHHIFSDFRRSCNFGCLLLILFSWAAASSDFSYKPEPLEAGWLEQRGVFGGGSRGFYSGGAEPGVWVSASEILFGSCRWRLVGEWVPTEGKTMDQSFNGPVFPWTKWTWS